MKKTVRSLMGVVMLGTMSLSQAAAPTTTAPVQPNVLKCTVKDTSTEGAVLLRAMSRFGDANAVKTLLVDKCVDISGRMASNPKLDHAAFLASSREVFNLYAKQGFDYTQKTTGRTFLMVSLEREKDEFRIDGDLKKMVEQAAKKYGITPSVPTKNPNETTLQELYVKGVPADNLLERDADKNNALHHAVSMGKGGLAQLIVRRQPDALTQKNALGLTPLMISSSGCGNPSLPAFYKSVGEEQWLKKFPVKDFENVALTPLQMHLLSGRDEVKSLVSPAKLQKEQEDLTQTLKKIPALQGILVKNIENSSICAHKNLK
jgi:hypothetical protein